MQIAANFRQSPELQDVVKWCIVVNDNASNLSALSYLLNILFAMMSLIT